MFVFVALFVAIVVLAIVEEEWIHLTCSFFISLANEILLVVIFYIPSGFSSGMTSVVKSG